MTIGVPGYPGSGGPNGASGTVLTGNSTTVAHTFAGVGPLKYELLPAGEVPERKSITDIVASIEQLYNVPGREQYKALDQLRKAAGYKDWQSALQAASSSNQPWQDFLVSMAKDSGGYGISAGGGGGGPYSQTQTQVTLSNASQSAAIIDQAYQQALGRSATEDEAKAFQSALNMMQKDNPTVSTTSGVRSGNNTTSSTTTKGGFDYTTFARDWARSQDGYAENYAGTTFMSLLDKALSQPDWAKQTVDGMGN